MAFWLEPRVKIGKGKSIVGVRGTQGQGKPVIPRGTCSGKPENQPEGSGTQSSRRMRNTTENRKTELHCVFSHRPQRLQWSYPLNPIHQSIKYLPNIKYATHREEGRIPRQMPHKATERQDERCVAPALQDRRVGPHTWCPHPVPGGLRKDSEIKGWKRWGFILLLK